MADIASAKRRPVPPKEAGAPAKPAPTPVADPRFADEWNGEMKALGGSKSKALNASLLDSVTVRCPRYAPAAGAFISRRL